MKNALAIGLFLISLLVLGTASANIFATDANGTAKAVFTVDETVYAKGTAACDGATNATQVRLYVIDEADLAGGENLTDVDSFETVTLPADGIVPVTEVWDDLEVGEYDLVLDLSDPPAVGASFGVFDSGSDCVDDNGSGIVGFTVTGAGAAAAGSGSAGSAGGVDIGDHGWFYNASAPEDNAMLQIRLTADGEDMQINSFTINASGSGDDETDVLEARVYRDNNNNGIVDIGDTLLGSEEDPFSQDNGGVVIATNFDVNSGSNATYILVTYVMSETAPIGDTYSLEVTAIDAEGEDSGESITFDDLPIESGEKTVMGYATIEKGSNSPGNHSCDPKDCQENEMLQLTLKASGEDFTFSFITIKASGSGDDQDDLTGVGIFRDNNGNGRIDSGDQLVGSRKTFSANDGTIEFNPGLTVAAGQSANLLIAYDVDEGTRDGRTFSLTVTEATAVGEDSSEVIEFSLSITSALKTISVPEAQPGPEPEPEVNETEPEVNETTNDTSEQPPAAPSISFNDPMAIAVAVVIIVAIVVAIWWYKRQQAIHAAHFGFPPRL